MLTRVVYSLLFTTLMCYYSTAQSEAVMMHGDVKFSGLHKSNENYLTSLLAKDTIKIFDLITVINNTQIITNLPEIRTATYRLDTLNQKVHTTYNVEEIRTLLPIINFGGIKDNLWYQIGITDNNWRGKGQQFAASYQNNDGYHSGQIYFKAPRLLNQKFGYSFSLSSWRSLEPLYYKEATVDYQYNINSIGTTGIYNFNLNRRIEIGATVFQEKYRKTNFQVNDNLPGPQFLTYNKLLSKIEYSENFIDYDYYYLKGHEWKILYQYVYTLDNQVRFNSIQLVNKIFLRPSQKNNIAMRFKLGLASNENSPFAPFVIDSHTNLRGVGNRIDRGTAQAIINLEYRRTLMHRNNWGAQVVGFTDLGTWRNPGGKIIDLINTNNFRQFIGIGFRLIYQKVFGATLRIDYGLDVYDKDFRGFVIGLGQYF